jgi:anti-anti-sigma factor
MNFYLRNKNEKGYTIIYIGGSLGYDGACKLNELVNNELNSGVNKIVLNLEDLKLIASYALSVILKISYNIKKKNGYFAIICPEGNVWDVFYVLELYKVIPFFESEEKFWENEKKQKGLS